MQCEDFAQKLDNYENLTEDEKLEMAMHADVCPDCRRELEFMQSIIDVTKTLPRLSVPDNFLAELNKRIDEEERATDKRNVIAHLRYNWHKYSAAAACLLLVAVIGTNGNMLVSRMNGNENGVIVESVSTAEPEKDIVPGKVQESESEATEAPAPQIKEKTKSDVGERTVSTVKEVRTPVRVETKSETKKSDEAVEVYNNTPQPTVVASTEAPLETEVPEVSSNDSNEIAAFSLNTRSVAEEPESLSTEAPQENPYEIKADGMKRNRYAIASGMQYPLDENGEPITDYFEKDKQEYSIYADTLIMIASEDYEKAMNIIWKHISGSYQSYYFVSIPSYEAMVSELSAEGVTFDANMSAITDTITFRVITY